MDAGHFHHSRLDYDELNINAQCRKCNRYLSGNLGEYAHALLKKHGPQILDLLKDRKQKYKPENTIELQKLLDRYTKLNKQNGYT